MRPGLIENEEFLNGGSKRMSRHYFFERGTRWNIAPQNVGHSGRKEFERPGFVIDRYRVPPAYETIKGRYWCGALQDLLAAGSAVIAAMISGEPRVSDQGRCMASYAITMTPVCGAGPLPLREQETTERNKRSMERQRQHRSCCDGHSPTDRSIHRSGCFGSSAFSFPADKSELAPRRSTASQQFAEMALLFISIYLKI